MSFLNSHFTCPLFLLSTLIVSGLLSFGTSLCVAFAPGQDISWVLSCIFNSSRHTPRNRAGKLRHGIDGRFGRLENENTQPVVADDKVSFVTILQKL
jgi:hypothetical protein